MRTVNSTAATTTTATELTDFGDEAESGMTSDDTYGAQQPPPPLSIDETVSVQSTLLFAF
jgi:hypothetical protein